MSLTEITLTGTYETLAGAPAQGRVSFVLSSTLYDTAADVAYPPIQQSVTLDGDGSFSVTLPATNDSTTRPTGLTYVVQESLSGSAPRAYSIELDHTLGSPQDLSDIAPSTDKTLVNYVLVSAFNAHTAATTAVHGITDTSKLVVTSSVEIQGLIVSGAATVKNNVLPPGAEIPAATTITTLKARVGTAPTGASLIVRFNLDGSSLGSVTINASSTSGSTTISQAATAGQILTFDLTQIGSSVAGSDVWIVVVGV